MCSYIVDWEKCCISQPMGPVKNRRMALQEWGLILYDPEDPQDMADSLVDF